MLVRLWKAARMVTIAVLALLAALMPEGIGATTSFTYDQLGRLTTALYDNGTCIAYAYDANGNRTSETITSAGAPEMGTWGTGVWGCFRWTSQ